MRICDVRVRPFYDVTRGVLLLAGDDREEMTSEYTQ